MHRSMLKKLIITGLIIVTIGAIVGISYVIKYSNYKEVEAINLIEERVYGTLDYERYLNGVMKVGRDGASYIDRKGNIVWAQAFLINNPTVRIREDKVVIVDKKGHQVFVFNEKGKVSDFKVPYTIIDISIGKNSVVAIAMEDKLYNYVHLYDSLGGFIAESKTRMEIDGLPLSIAISQDGSKLATSYLHTDGTKINSRITFYRFDDIGKNHIDNFLGSFTVEDRLVPQIEFINNNTLVAFSDNKVILYDAYYIPAIKEEIPVEEKIAAVFVKGEYIGVVNDVPSETQTYKVHIYDSEGRLSGEVNTNLEFKEVLVNEKEVIIHNGYRWEIYNFRGKLKYEGEFQEEVKRILPIKKGKHIIVSESKVEEITLK